MRVRRTSSSADWLAGAGLVAHWDPVVDGDIVLEITGEAVFDFDDGVVGKSDRAVDGVMVSRAVMLGGAGSKRRLFGVVFRPRCSVVLSLC